MRERPILFSEPMVRALLEGRKTQTRRIVKPQPDWLPEVHTIRRTDHVFWPLSGERGHQCGAPIVGCRYGLPGDVLWVKETYRLDLAYDPDKPRQVPTNSAVFFAAGGQLGAGVPGKPRPSIHMRRCFSRITLRITDVRIERLQKITDADALAEGVYPGEQPPATFDRTYAPTMPVHLYGGLWEHINGPGSWDANPWVWAVSFERI